MQSSKSYKGGLKRAWAIRGWWYSGAPRVSFVIQFAWLLNDLSLSLSLLCYVYIARAVSPPKREREKERARTLLSFLTVLRAFFLSLFSFLYLALYIEREFLCWIFAGDGFDDALWNSFLIYLRTDN